MSEIELMECPCCGSGDDLRWMLSRPAPHNETHDVTAVEYKIDCRGCGLQTDWMPEKCELITAWNTRPRQSELEGIVRELVKFVKEAQEIMDEACPNDFGRRHEIFVEGSAVALTRARKIVEG